MEYKEVLDRAHEIKLLMIAAYKAGDYKTAITLAEDLGKLYAPDDTLLASKLGYLIKSLADEMWFAGRLDQLSR